MRQRRNKATVTYSLFMHDDTRCVVADCARTPLQSSDLGALEVRTTRID